jgi:hypothetical protein
MDLIARMDRLCQTVFLDRVRPSRPHILRWYPVLALGVLATGYALIAANQRIDRIPAIMAGVALYILGSLASGFLRLYGPRLQGGLDERENAIRARAVALAGTVFVWAAISACLYFAMADALGLWRPIGPPAWVLLGFTLEPAYRLLPTLFASWLQPRDVPEE